MTSKRSKKVRDARYTTMAARPEWAIIEQARRVLMACAAERSTSIHEIDYVATFEDWDDGIAVWVFFPLDQDLRLYEGNGVVDGLRVEYLRILNDLGYPFDRFPRVTFVFDSDENVQRNFEGSYFYRLR
jgi:hypothetical protein